MLLDVLQKILASDIKNNNSRYGNISCRVIKKNDKP